MERRGEVDPRAYLRYVRNVRKGIETRTKILNLLSEGPRTIDNLSKDLGLSKSTVRKHMVRLEKERIVEREGRRRASWKLTGYGQMAIGSFMGSSTTSG